jgi:hypothetical protein
MTLRLGFMTASLDDTQGQQLPFLMSRIVLLQAGHCNSEIAARRRIVQGTDKKAQ